MLLFGLLVDGVVVPNDTDDVVEPKPVEAPELDPKPTALFCVVFPKLPNPVV